MDTILLETQQYHLFLIGLFRIGDEKSFSFIYVVLNGNIPLLFKGYILSHCLHMIYFLHSFTHQWTFRLFLCLNYSE